MIAPLASRHRPAVPPLKIYRFFLRGMEQQMWFFGQDARHGGNLLERYGFERFRSGKQGSSRYRFPWRLGTTVELHSFCAGLYRDAASGFLYIRGKGNAYRYEASEPPDPECFCHAPIAIPEHTDPADPFYPALALFTEWLGEYEAWITKTAGDLYRKRLHPHCPVPWLLPADAICWLRRFGSKPLDAPLPRRACDW